MKKRCMEESSVVVFFVILRGMVYWSGVSPRLLTRHIFRTILPTVVKCVHINGIDNCYFTETGNEDWGCLAIAAGYVSDIHIVHNEICEVPYSGISLGWGWSSDSELYEE